MNTIPIAISGFKGRYYTAIYKFYCDPFVTDFSRVEVIPKYTVLFFMFVIFKKIISIKRDTMVSDLNLLVAIFRLSIPVIPSRSKMNSEL